DQGARRRARRRVSSSSSVASVSFRQGGRQRPETYAPNCADVKLFFLTIRGRKHGSGTEQGTGGGRTRRPSACAARHGMLRGTSATPRSASGSASYSSRVSRRTWSRLAPPRQAHLDGFNLHADVSAPAGNRARLEHFCRYLLPSPIAQERLALTPTRGAARDGRVLVTLRAE